MTTVVSVFVVCLCGLAMATAQVQQHTLFPQQQAQQRGALCNEQRIHSAWDC